MVGDLDQLLHLALVARRENRPDEARRDLVEAVSLARAAGSRSDLARTLTRLGAIERDLRNLRRALIHYQEAAAIYRVEGDELKLAHTVRHVGDIHQDDGHLEIAEPLYVEALAIYRTRSDTPALDLANAIRGLALLEDATGRTDQAKLLWEEALGLYAAEGVEGGVVECTRRLAR